MTDLFHAPDFRPLLASVLAAPRDDAPRLILADYAEERGMAEWAEFVRWGCKHKRTVITNRLHRAARALFTVETEGTPSETCYGRPPHMTDEMFVWFKRFSSEVVAPSSSWTTMCERSGWECVWHRGFPARLRMPADDAFDRLGGLLESWPITTVVLTQRLNVFNHNALRERFQSWRDRNLDTDVKMMTRFFGGRVRFREDYPRLTGYRLPEGFRSTITLSRPPAITIRGGHD